MYSDLDVFRGVPGSHQFRRNRFCLLVIVVFYSMYIYFFIRVNIFMFLSYSIIRISKLKIYINKKKI